MSSQNSHFLPWTARVDSNNNIKTNPKSLKNRKVTYDDCMQSISPWEVNQFSSLKRNAQQEKNKMRKYFNKLGNKKVNANIFPQYLVEDRDAIYIQTSQNPKQYKNKRSKTEAQHNSSANRIRLNTIQVSNNLNVLSNQKYFSEDCQQRKMSMNKFRENFLQTGRTKNNQFFFQTKTQIQKKINEKILANNQPFKQTSDTMLIKKLKTVQNENETPLMFFFEAKSSKNMMQREKNIMKIRNISKKLKRLHNNN